MKDFSKLLQKNNLTPKERIRLYIHDGLNREKTGKDFLSEADKQALMESWIPKNNDEVRDYNRYKNGWSITCYAESDAQTCYLRAKIAFQTLSKFLSDFQSYPQFRRVDKALKAIGKMKQVTSKEAIDIINRQKTAKLERGLLLSKAVYYLTFQLTDPKTKKQILDLYEDAEFETDYLDEEEEISELYNKKDFEAIAERVSDCYKTQCERDYIVRERYYANIPVNEIAKRYAGENKIPFTELTPEDKIIIEKGQIATAKGYLEIRQYNNLKKALLKHAEENKTSLKEIIKTACLKWIKEGLLEKDHQPLIICEPELLKKWTATKDKARKTLQDLIKAGTLKTEDKKAGRNTEAGLYITGKSLYNSGLDYAFVKEFKNDADKYKPDSELVFDKDGQPIDLELIVTDDDLTFSRFNNNISMAKTFIKGLSFLEEKKEGGEIVVSVKETGGGKKRETDIIDMITSLKDEFISSYELLLSFDELFKRASKVYDIDLTEKITAWINDCKGMIEFNNNILKDAIRSLDIEQAPIYQDSRDKEQRRWKDDTLFIDPAKIKPNDSIGGRHRQEMIKILGKEFEDEQD